MKTILFAATVFAAIGAGAHADDYFHRGRSAPPDFSAVNAYEASFAALEPLPSGTQGYNHVGSHAAPDFDAVKRYVAQAATVQLASSTPGPSYNHAGTHAQPDFQAVNAYIAAAQTSALASRNGGMSSADPRLASR